MNFFYKKLQKTEKKKKGKRKVIFIFVGINTLHSAQSAESKKARSWSYTQEIESFVLYILMQ